MSPTDEHPWVQAVDHAIVLQQEATTSILCRLCRRDRRSVKLDPPAGGFAVLLSLPDRLMEAWPGRRTLLGPWVELPPEAQRKAMEAPQRSFASRGSGVRIPTTPQRLRRSEAGPGSSDPTSRSFVRNLSANPRGTGRNLASRDGAVRPVPD
jgi:hypothetical protein